MKLRNYKPNSLLNKKFNTHKEAAQAKIDFLMNEVFKGVDWSKQKRG